ncbi:MAG: hypothetical protein GZ091_08745 [Paludibacter sp.]|nr:hypothetical protein [Paludibacter sp.]
MARQLGHVKYKGTIGEIRHFKIKGMTGNFAGLKGGATGEQIKNDPGFVRTRENMNEFGGCAHAARSIRVGLNMLMKQMSDAQLTGRLTAIMKKINLEDLSEARGYRAILVSTQSKYLVGLNFNRNASFESSFIEPFELTSNENSNSSTLTVAAFNPAKSVIAPAGATHFRLINAVSVISDFAFNATTGVYEPIQQALNEMSNVEFSGYLDLTTAIAVPTVITSALPGEPEINDDVTVMNSIGIEFYQKAGNEYYLLNAGHALKIQTTF